MALVELRPYPGFIHRRGLESRYLGRRRDVARRRRDRPPGHPQGRVHPDYPEAPRRPEGHPRPRLHPRGREGRRHRRAREPRRTREKLRSSASATPCSPKPPRLVASPQIRNMGTMGGNICQEPRCWYYRNPEDRFSACARAGQMPRHRGENRFHSIFGAAQRGLAGLPRELSGQRRHPAVLGGSARATWTGRRGSSS